MPTSGEAAWPRRSIRSARCAWLAANSGVSSANALYRGPPAASRLRKRRVNSTAVIFFARKARPRSTTVAKCRSSPCNALIYSNTTVRRRGDSARRQEDASVPARGRAGPGHWPQSRRSRVPHTPPKICVVGSSNMDLISRVPHLPRLGETIVGHSFHMGYGGKGANQAVQAGQTPAPGDMGGKPGGDGVRRGPLGNNRQQGGDTTYVFFDDERASGVAPS